ANSSLVDANVSLPPDKPPNKPNRSKPSMKNWQALKISPPPPLASLTGYGSSGLLKANAQHAMKPPSAMPWSPDTGSNPKVSPSETTSSSTPTNLPTTSPTPSVQTTDHPASHLCLTASPSPAESAHTSPQASLTQTSPTAACVNPAQAAKP